MADPVHTIITVGGAVAAVLLLWGAGLKIGRFVRRLVHFLDDWNGADARPGVPACPGVMERLDDHAARITQIEAQTKQLVPNGGAHLADRVERIEKRLPNAETLERIEARLAVVNLSHKADVHQLPDGEDSS